ncbi:hypothetical protein EVAR_97385_1 [Eumeta japonica]|uniref:Uncharacterized protein n=1 Tax=Eumeta variegata TaxID=151549 RepID=A0A4C1TFT5_EUMVA|nr:hypothetical protein EVAR_97385_1 [Eumeta japonica]
MLQPATDRAGAAPCGVCVRLHRRMCGNSNMSRRTSRFGKRYAYRFDWAGLVAACQGASAEPPPYWRYLPPRARPRTPAAGAARQAHSRPETSERLRSDSTTARADSAITAMTLNGDCGRVCHILRRGPAVVAVQSNETNATNFALSASSQRFNSYCNSNLISATISGPIPLTIDDNKIVRQREICKGRTMWKYSFAYPSGNRHPLTTFLTSDRGSAIAEPVVMSRDATVSDFSSSSVENVVTMDKISDLLDEKFNKSLSTYM